MGFLTNFVFYDLALLAVFVILSVYFLHRNRANLEKQGIIYLYKAKWGIKLIHYFGKKYKRILGILSYVSVIVGYGLMLCMVILFAQSIYIYIRFPQVTQIVKAPPIVPIIPYFTNIFGLESFFPPFYFTYFIIAVSFVAIAHEFSHGIFASYNNLKSVFSSDSMAVALLDSPAIKSGFPNVDPIHKAAINEINDVKIKSYNELSNEIAKYSPGETINLKIKNDKEEKIYNLTLEPHPNNPNLGYLGITSQTTSNSITGKLLNKINFYKNPQVSYEPVTSPIIVILIHDFLWWIALINLLVALFNMLPLGILDGGRFFYLTILAITKSEKISKRFFSAITYIILLLLALVMLIWFYQVFIV